MPATTRRPGQRRPLVVTTRRVRRAVVGFVVVQVLAAAGWALATAAVAPAVAARIGVRLLWVQLAAWVLFAVLAGLAAAGLARRSTVQALRALDAERAATRARQQEVERIRASFLRGVSHELRTPLTTILGYVETIKAHHRVLDPGALDHLSDRMVVNTKRLERLVLDLLDLHRLGDRDHPVQSETVRLDALLLDACGEPDLDHPVVVDAPGIDVRLDSAKTRRIVRELVDNVARHTPAGTRARVEAVVTPDDLLVLEVVDEGPGVDPRIHGAVDQPFVQGGHVDTLPSPGLGIGLALVGRYAELQGGSVEITGAPGGGTVVRVVLPVAVHAGA